MKRKITISSGNGKNEIIAEAKTAAFDVNVPFNGSEVESIKTENYKFINGYTCEKIAYFGVAVYYAQMVEESLRQLIVFSCEKTNDLIHPDRLENMTLGQLFSWIKKNVKKDFDLIGEKEVAKAISYRNYITHWIHSQAIPSGKNDEMVIKMLITCILFFKDLDSHIGSLIYKYESTYLHMRTMFLKEPFEELHDRPKKVSKKSK